MNPAQITVVGADNQLMPVNVPAWFEIRGAVPSADGDLIVNIICQSICPLTYLLTIFDTYRLRSCNLYSMTEICFLGWHEKL